MHQEAPPEELSNSKRELEQKHIDIEINKSILKHDLICYLTVSRLNEGGGLTKC